MKGTVELEPKRGANVYYVISESSIAVCVNTCLLCSQPVRIALRAVAHQCNRNIAVQIYFFERIRNSWFDRNDVSRSAEATAAANNILPG